MSANGTIKLDVPLLTARQAGELLGDISAKSVLAYAREGRIPCVRIGKHVRFYRADLERVLSRSRGL